MLQGPSVLLGSHAFLRRGDVYDTCNHCVSSTPHQLLLFPIASWTTQTKMQNKESGFLSHISVKTKLELNYNYNKTSTAEDDVSQRKQELLVSLESWYVRGAPFSSSAKEMDSILQQWENGKHKHTLHFLLLFWQLFSSLQVSLSHSQWSRTEITGNKNIWHMCFSLSTNLKAHANKSLLLLSVRCTNYVGVKVSD